jgi:hypothetical protein
MDHYLRMAGFDWITTTAPYECRVNLICEDQDSERKEPQ